MNNVQYGIRRKGDDELVLTYNSDIEKDAAGCFGLVFWLDEFPHEGHQEWLCGNTETALNVLNETSQFDAGSSLNPRHNLSKDDYEVVKIERKVTVIS